MLDATMLLELALKSVVVGGATLAVLRLTRQRSAAERSLIGHLGLVALVVLPAVSLLLPGWNPLPASPAAAPIRLDLSAAPAAAALDNVAGGLAEGAGAAGPSFALPSAGELAVWLYALPLVLLLAAMVVAVVRLGAMHRRASVMVEAPWLAALAQAQRRMGFKHGTALLVSDELRSPVSWGLMRPIILLSAQAVGAVREAEAIIAHELAHVARLDWAKLLISRIACALFWFNPLAWRLARECHQLREEAADDAVLLSEVDGAEYATLLVKAARHDNRALLLAAHGVAPGKDSLKRRITRVLDADLARGPANNAWAALCLVSLVAVAAPLAAFDPTAQGRAVPAVAPMAAAQAQPGLPASAPAAVQVPAIPVALAQASGDEDGSSPAARDGRRDRDTDREIDSLIAYKAVGMSPEYIAAMRAAGFAGADADDLTGARAVGVTPEFARQMRRTDPSVDLDTVIAAKATGLSADYFSEMRRIFPRLSLEDAVGMNAVGVTAGFAREMRALFPKATAEDIQGMKAVGVTPAFVKEMRRQGLSASDPDEAIEGRMLSANMRGAPVANAVGLATAIAGSVSRGMVVPAPVTPPAPPGRPRD